MNLQDIRKYYEYPVIDCCNLQGVEFRAENTLEPGGDAIHKFCLARLQFGEMAEQTIYCGPAQQQASSLRCRIPRPERYRSQGCARFYGMRHLPFSRTQRHREHQRPRLHFT